MLAYPLATPRSKSLSHWSAIAIPVAAIIVAFVALPAVFGGTRHDFNAAAIDSDYYEMVWATIGGRHIHCSDVSDAETCLAPQRTRGNAPVVLWLGNSQLHAVGRASRAQPLAPGETNAPGVLATLLTKQQQDLLAFSMPNANPQEQYVLFEYLRPRVNVGTVILPLVFLNFRDTGLRDTVAKALSDPATITALTETELGRHLISENKTAEQPSDTSGLAGSPQKWMEDKLNAGVSRILPAWELREEARGQILLALDRLRRTVFATTGSSKRRIIAAAYGPDMDAVDAIFADAQRSHMRVIPYLAPIRHDVELPFTSADYDRFVTDLTAIAARYQTTLLDFSNLVPAQYWGERPSTQLGAEGEFDFLHFQAPGHAILGQRLYQELE